MGMHCWTEMDSWILGVKVKVSRQWRGCNKYLLKLSDSWKCENGAPEITMKRICAQITKCTDTRNIFDQDF